MFYYNQYVRAQSLDEAYELYQKNRILCWAACFGSK